MNDTHLWNIFCRNLKVQLPIDINLPGDFHLQSTFCIPSPDSFLAGQVVDREADVEPGKGHPYSGSPSKVFYP